MTDKQKQTRLWPVVLIAAAVVALVLIWAAARPKNTENTRQPELQNPAGTHQRSEQLNNVIKQAKGWGPAHTQWYGKDASDFNLTGFDGKQLKLSDYRGKNVMLIFWATWCAPCKIELPHLIALRNITPQDQLVMLAISNENPKLVKTFAEKNKLNYPVFAANTSAMPKPFSQIRGIPASFFINPEGKIKLATEGLLSLEAMKAIIKAK
ncbi:MAG: peroxiredoxin family protein [Planctomycetota bacterium]|jgi:peroxiredoxin